MAGTLVEGTAIVQSKDGTWYVLTLENDEERDSHVIFCSCSTKIYRRN